jgi:outer membrane porin, OprD family
MGRCVAGLLKGKSVNANAQPVDTTAWRERAIAGLLTAGLLMAALPGAARAADGLANALGRDSEVTLHFRSYYFDRQNPGDVTNAAWAVGGWAGYQTGWIGDALRFGVVGYTSQRLWGPLDKDGTLLLEPQQQSFSTIGEAFVSLKLWDQVLTGGRFQVSQPEINATDNRMVPITYSGGNLSGALAGVSYYAAYLNATKPKDRDDFINFAAAANIAGPASEPLYLFGLAGGPHKDLSWRLSSYYVPNILSSSYADVAWSTPLNEAYKLRLGAQAMYQQGVGEQLLTGADFSTWSGGVKADLLRGPATLSLAYQQTGSEWAYQTPYSGWAGYTYMIVKSFNQAGMKAWLLGANYDFAAMNLPGLAVNGAIVHGWDAINPSTGAALANWTEYDLTLDYRFGAKQWPEWARPFWIRGRAAYVGMGDDGHIEDYRVIVNYEWVF